MVDIDITLESLERLGRVLDLEQRLVELRLEVSLLVLNARVQKVQRGSS